MKPALLVSFLLLIIMTGCTSRDSSTSVHPASTSAVQNTPSPNAAQSEVGIAAEVRQLLPIGNLTVDIMELGAPPRANELAMRIALAAQENPDWWQEYVQSAEPGEPLPYHPNMGITEEEYQEFLTLSRQMVLVKADTTTIEVVEDQHSLIRLDGGEKLPDLTGIEIDLIRNHVQTPFGTSEQQTRITATEGQRATGPWNGIQWELEEINGATGSGTASQFAIGKLQESGRGILYYDVQRVTMDGPENITIILQYDL